ncbi:CHAT domain-containing protein [Sphingomonas azotifigens]|uniref:CHAT domain-containing protein n=1 Tax=Sphingomonas azotifigens TaxID=330920 RepID=UPI001430170E|nr:CHAT domain-containing protein [Sphingomonas azotifigens]
MGKKRYKRNIVQVADQVSGSPDLTLGALIPAEDITLTVTVRPNGNTFTCDIANFPHMVHAPMTWKWADFEAELDALAPYARQLSKPGAATPDVIQEIAARGKILFEKVFATDAARSAIRDACAGPGATEILFYTDSFALCWPLLYLGTDIQKVEVEQFLGMRASILRTLQSTTNEASQSRRDDAPIGSAVRLNYAWDKSFKQIETRERPYMVELDVKLDQPRVSVFEVPALEPNGPAFAQAKELFDGLNREEPKIIHLSCHYEAGEELASKRFRLRDGAFVTFHQMSATEVTFTSRPLLFFNACEVAKLKPDRTENFPEYCMRMGAECIVAPEFEVHDFGAADMAEVFYDKLLKDRRSISDALHDAKMHLWTEKKSLTGLLYAVYGQSYRTYQ